MRLATPRIASRATPTYSGFPGIFSSTTASPSLVDTGPSVLLFELCEGVPLVVIDLEDLRQAGDLKDPKDAHILTDQAQVTISLSGSLQAADQDAQTRAVQVLDTVQ